MANPNPTRITAPMWDFWTKFDALEPSALLGGVYADKAGYHNYRSKLPATDYSVGRDVAADKLGPSDKACAIDLTMSAAAMVKYTNRLDVAARAKDPRLYLAGAPILREFIGTKDNKTVYCWVFVGGRALGVAADAGPDPGRDKSHLWHVHLSVIRAYITNPVALNQIFSILKGEPLETWIKAAALKVPAAKAPTFPGRVLRRNDAQANPDAAVKTLQDRLIAVGFGNLGRTGDGFFGPGTERAVTVWQAVCGLPRDGVVAAGTWPTPWTRSGPPPAPKPPAPPPVKPPAPTPVPVKPSAPPPATPAPAPPPAKEVDVENAKELLNADVVPNRPWRADATTNPTVRWEWAVVSTWDEAHAAHAAAQAANEKSDRVLALVQAMTGRDFTDENAIIAGVLQGLTPQAIAAAVVTALPREMAQQVVDELGNKLQAA